MFGIIALLIVFAWFTALVYAETEREKALMAIRDDIAPYELMEQ